MTTTKGEIIGVAILISVLVLIGVVIATAYRGPPHTTEHYAAELLPNTPYQFDAAVGPAGYPALVTVNATEVVTATFAEQTCVEGFAQGCSSIPEGQSVVGTNFNATVQAVDLPQGGTIGDLYVTLQSPDYANVTVSVTWEG